jgi:hypothetical protein
LTSQLLANCFSRFTSVSHIPRRTQSQPYNCRHILPARPPGKRLIQKPQGAAGKVSAGGYSLCDAMGLKDNKGRYNGYMVDICAPFITIGLLIACSSVKFALLQTQHWNRRKPFDNNPHH